MSMKRRVVITGFGLLTPIGKDPEAFWSGLVAGKSGVRSITRFDPSGYPTTIAAEIDGFDPLDYMDRKEARRMDRFAQYGLAAARQALERSGLKIEGQEAERVGVMVGTGSGGLDMIQREYARVLTQGPNRLSPYLAPAMLANMASGEIAVATGARGISAAVVTACATGSSCIGEGMRAIQHGTADVVLAGGAEAPITPLGLAAFSKIRALSRRNDDPQRACRPFDRDRDGFVAGEGAGVVVLEEADHARRRGATIYAELVGYGSSTDAYHITAPDPEGAGAVRAMRLAFADAGMTPDQVEYINAHGTGTRFNDAIEAAAIKKVFGERARHIPINSIKSMIGHLLGAAGAVELIASIQALQHGIIPPTLNCDHPEDSDLDFVPHWARRRDIRAAMSNSFGFGGHNVSLIIKRWEE
jgi:3-oxoacyl-[acyl-carrier-protein] synthase II